MGTNPVRGGRPPRDRSTRGNIIVTSGALVDAVAKELMVVDDVNFKVRNAAVVVNR